MATTFGKNLQGMIGRYADQGFPGMIREAISTTSYIYPFNSGSQVVTVTIGAIVASTNYSVTVNNVTVSTNSAALTNVQTADALALALRRSSYVGGRYTVTSAAGVITMTHRQGGVNETVTVSGGASTVSAVAAIFANYLPLGLVLAQASGIVDNELPTLRLPNSAADVLVGIGGVYSHNDGWVRDSSGAVVRGVNPGGAVTVVRKGNIFVACEGSITAGASLFWRHTVNGALNQVGAIAGAAGTGLAALPSAVATANSFTIGNGQNVVAIDINLP